MVTVMAMVTAMMTAVDTRMKAMTMTSGMRSRPPAGALRRGALKTAARRRSRLGAPPRFRLRAVAGAALDVQASSIETLRSDGTRQLFAMTDRGGFLESRDEI